MSGQVSLERLDKRLDRLHLQLAPNVHVGGDNSTQVENVRVLLLLDVPFARAMRAILHAHVMFHGDQC